MKKPRPVETDLKEGKTGLVQTERMKQCLIRYERDVWNYEIGLYLGLPVANLDAPEIHQAALEFIRQWWWLRAICEVPPQNLEVALEFIREHLRNPPKPPESVGTVPESVVLSPNTIKQIAKIVASGTEASNGRLSVGKLPSLKALLHLGHLGD
jgi:hypothetical protein